MSKKARKLARSEAQPGAAEPPSAPVAEQEFFFLPAEDPLEVDERELHQVMKQWRHGRATRTIGQAIQDGYVALFSIVMLGAMVVNVMVGVQAGSAACTTDACASARLGIPAATLLIAATVTLAVARLFGPVIATAAEGSWLMDAPISRRRLLRPRLVLPVLLSGVFAAVLAAAVTLLVGTVWLGVVVWSLAAGVLSAAVMALAAAVQSNEQTRLLAVAQAIASILALATVAGVISVAAGWLPSIPAGLVTAAVPAAAGLAMVATPLLAWGTVVGLRRLEQIRRSRLLSGGSLVSGMQGAMFALDFGLIRDIVVERRAVRKGHVTPRQGRGTGVAALIWRDLERLWRDPRPLVGLAVSLVVPYALDALRVSQLNPLLSGLVLFVALVPFLGGLRVLTRTSGLARMLPFKTTTLRSASMVVPAVLALLWAVAAVPAFHGIAVSGPDRNPGESVMVALATAAAGLFGAVRWVTAKRVDFNVPMLATESGAMPPTLLFNLFRGFDMVLLITAPMILQAPATVSIGIAAVVFVGLRGTFNMEELQAEKDALERQEAARGQSGPKRIVAPSQPRR